MQVTLEHMEAKNDAYVIVNPVSGYVFAERGTLQAAQIYVGMMETIDMMAGVYQQGFYEIKKKETC